MIRKDGSGQSSGQRAEKAGATPRAATGWREEGNPRIRTKTEQCPALPGVERKPTRGPLSDQWIRSPALNLFAPTRSTSGFNLGFLGIDSVAELHNVGKSDWMMGQGLLPRPQSRVQCAPHCIRGWQDNGNSSRALFGSTSSSRSGTDNAEIECSTSIFLIEKSEPRREGVSWTLSQGTAASTQSDWAMGTM